MPIEAVRQSITDSAEQRSEERLGFTARRAAILAAVVCVLTLTIAGPVRTYFAQRTEMKQLSATEAALRKQIADLEGQKTKLGDPVFIAAQARERLGFVMPGDIPYQVQLPPGLSLAAGATMANEIRGALRELRCSPVRPVVSAEEMPTACFTAAMMPSGPRWQHARRDESTAGGPNRHLAALHLKSRLLVASPCSSDEWSISLRATSLPIRACASAVEPPMCGVRMTLGRPRSGDRNSSRALAGSSGKTSAAAPSRTVTA